MKDLLGKEFEVGQTVVYGGRCSSTSGYVAVGEIVRINNHAVRLTPSTLTVRVIKHSAHVAPGGLSVVQRPNRAVIK